MTAIGPDSPSSREQSAAEPVEATESSGNVFADLRIRNPGVERRLADARIAGLPKPIARALAGLVAEALTSNSENDPQLVTALDGAIAAISRAVLPAEMTPELHEVLGLPNFRTCPIAHLFRAGGAEIRPKVEDEQAYVLFWLLHLVLQHGTGWYAASKIDVDAAYERRKANLAAAETSEAPRTGATA